MRHWSEHNFGYAAQRQWLSATGSMSQRLAQTGSVFSVQVLRQGRLPLQADEARALAPLRSRQAYVRETLLQVDGQSLVFARSVTAHHYSLGVWRALRFLGSQPLALLLFGRAETSRQSLQYQRLAPASPLARRIRQQAPKAPRSLAARRSIFLRRRAALLVTEVFISTRLAQTQAGMATAAKINC